MSRLIITCDKTDDDVLWNEVYTDHTFSVYDLESKSLIYIKEKIDDLETKTEYWGRPNFRPFGVTSSEDKIYVASNDMIGIFDKTDYDYISLLNIPSYVNTHQLLIDEEILYVCHTAVDTIGIHNLKNNSNTFINVLKCTNLCEAENVKIDHVYDFDRLHINSLYKIKNTLYFCAHNRGPQESKFGFIDLNTLDVYPIFQGGMKAHNVIVLDNFLYSLSSGTGDFMRYNLRTGELRLYPIMDPEKIFLRGMVIHNNNLLIGCSNVQTNSERVISYLVEFNTKTETFKKFMDIPSACYITDMHIVV